MGRGGSLVGRQVGQPLGKTGDGLGQLAHVAVGEVLFIGMVFLEHGQPLQFGIGLSQGEHGGVARRNSFDFGIGQLLTANVLGTAEGVFAPYYLGNESGFGLEGLPHEGIKASLSDIAINGHFLVVVALARMRPSRCSTSAGFQGASR